MSSLLLLEIVSFVSINMYLELVEKLESVEL